MVGRTFARLVRVAMTNRAAAADLARDFMAFAGSAAARRRVKSTDRVRCRTGQ